MNIDLRHSFKEGTDLLRAWRNRYEKSEYPEKILLNIFYRKYTMKFIWNDINDSFQRKAFGGRKILWNDFNEGYKKLKLIYSHTSAIKTQPVLMRLISEKSSQKVGGISYSDYYSRIDGARQGNQTDIEEIEYAYLYYLLSDECILLWSAIGGTGLSKTDAITKMSGSIIETPEINSYAEIEGIVGRLCSAPYLKEVYTPLPPND